MHTIVSFFFFSSRRRHTRFDCDWSSDVCSSDLVLLRKIEGISQKVLTQTLRQLERNGLVERCERGSRPLHVEYRLTEVARGLVDTLAALDRWAEHNFPVLDAARERFDAR